MNNKELLNLLQDRVLEKYVALDIIRMKEDMEFWESFNDITEDTKRLLKLGKENLKDDLHLAYDEFNMPIYYICKSISDTSLTINDLTGEILTSFQDRIIHLPNVERYIQGLDLYDMAMGISREVFYGNLSIII